jgi:hypothetical protein
MFLYIVTLSYVLPYLGIQSVIETLVAYDKKRKKGFIFIVAHKHSKKKISQFFMTALKRKSCSMYLQQDLNTKYFSGTSWPLFFIPYMSLILPNSKAYYYPNLSLIGYPNFILTKMSSVMWCSLLEVQIVKKTEISI